MSISHSYTVQGGEKAVVTQVNVDEGGEDSFTICFALEGGDTHHYCLKNEHAKDLFSELKNYIEA